jgi:transposase
MEKYRVTLTDEERQSLEALVRHGKAAARKLNHARILLLADEGDGGPGRADEQIVDALGVGTSTVFRVRKRFVTEGLEAAIHPRPQPPRPDKIKLSGKAEQRVIALACSDPPDGRGSWTLQLLADQLVVLREVDSVSRETVRQTLKKTTFRSGS